MTLVSTAVGPVVSGADEARRRRDLWLFVAITFGGTWGLAALVLVAQPWVEAVFGAFDTTNPLYFLAVYCPSLTAIGLTAARYGRRGLRELVARVFKWRVRPVYYAVVVLGFIAVDCLARLVEGASWENLLNGTPPTPMAQWYLAPVFLLVTLVLDAGPVGEEIGWRGFALPRLLAGGRHPVLLAVGLGVVWGMWHLPAFVVAGTHQHNAAMSLLGLLTGTVLVTIVMTWLYLRTGGSVLVAGILVHLMNNSATASLWPLNLVLALPAAWMAVDLHRKRP